MTEPIAVPIAELVALWTSKRKVTRAELRRLWKRARIDHEFWPMNERQWRHRIIARGSSL